MKNTTIFRFLQKHQDGSRKYLFSRFSVFLLLLTIWSVLPNTGYSQYYNVNTACATPYNDISVTGTQLAVNPDFNTFTSLLPFDFQFFGQNYVTPTLRISVDGYILWNAATGQLPQDNQSLPTADPDIAPGGGIFPHWDFQAAFIVPSSGIYVQSDGVAPNRTYTIQWDSIYKVISTGPTVLSNDVINFQVILYETSNEIKFVYGDTFYGCLLYTSPSPRDRTRSRMPSSA